ncbi:hypothetical protein EJ08DRAFT_23122 [Tothia fuscella]|uniref:Uncharacterized protein n=1 Tax=Tothia fuscella TaxID=1048955 RepID=A0A9P4U217_9PEZI|nr:hypothetical protein EJ08DRAFT_23122 [Tothia fuscella]
MYPSYPPVQEHQQQYSTAPQSSGVSYFPPPPNGHLGAPASPQWQATIPLSPAPMYNPAPADTCHNGNAAQARPRENQKQESSSNRPRLQHHQHYQPQQCVSQPSPDVPAGICELPSPIPDSHQLSVGSSAPEQDQLVQQLSQLNMMTQKQQQQTSQQQHTTQEQPNQQLHSTVQYSQVPNPKYQQPQQHYPPPPTRSSNHPRYPSYPGQQMTSTGPQKAYGSYTPVASPPPVQQSLPYFPPPPGAHNASPQSDPQTKYALIQPPSSYSSPSISYSTPAQTPSYPTPAPTPSNYSSPLPSYPTPAQTPSYPMQAQISSYPTPSQTPMYPAPPTQDVNGYPTPAATPQVMNNEKAYSN